MLYRDVALGRRYSTYHVIDLVHADQSRGKLEHIVAQRDDDELGVLGAFFDVSSDDGNLREIKPHG